jgi:hypothetical protein
LHPDQQKDYRRPKRPVTVDLSDSEGDEEEDEEEGEDVAVVSKPRRQKSDSDDVDSGDSGGEGDSDEGQSVAISWWQRRWPRELLKEKESSWHVAGHCRSRTQMYHTLMHYKARLFLKIR